MATQASDGGGGMRVFSTDLYAEQVYQRISPVHVHGAAWVVATARAHEHRSISRCKITGAHSETVPSNVQKVK
jgi:hypothetical protein